MPLGFLMGSGGANDVASTAAEVIVVARQSRQRFVELVNYVTSPGKRVSTIITQFGVYRKAGDELVLACVFTKEDIQRARETCAWDLHMAREVDILPLPSVAEREALQRFDPYGDLWGE